MAHEHERAAGPWHAEWRPMCELLETVGSAAAWLRDCLEHLEVDPERMRANLHDALLAERVARALAGPMGREAADAAVRAALDEGRSLAALAGEHLADDEVARLVDPASYLGATDALIDRALAAHGRRP
jgi:3-carboxy-cis,cis-muconate cycloisomerase